MNTKKKIRRHRAPTLRKQAWEAWERRRAEKARAEAKARESAWRRRFGASED